MSGTLRIDPPQPEWLTFERARFGFEAQAGSGRFSFSDTFTMINLRAKQFSKDSAGLRILVSPSLCNLVLVDVVSGESKLLRSLDEVLNFDEYSDDKYNSAVTMFGELRIHKYLLTSFTMSRDMLVNAVRTSLNENFARIHARVGSRLATVFTEIPADSFRAFKSEHFHSGRAGAVDGSRLFSIHVAPEGGLSAAPGRSGRTTGKAS
jgi:hypothetical protein